VIVPVTVAFTVVAGPVADSARFGQAPTTDGRGIVPGSLPTQLGEIDDAPVLIVAVWFGRRHRRPCRCGVDRPRPGFAL
jgi:hypothetical protein